MIRKADRRDIPALAALALLLWPGHTAKALEEEFSQRISGEDVAFFLAWEGERPVGFAQCQLRHDYVEGTESSPVGYLEGIYVAEGFRRLGLGKHLLAQCEGWAKSKGCAEFASDCELENARSLRFHLGVGFAEANRIICFTKRL